MYKKGWQEPDAVAVLYSLYRYAEKRTLGADCSRIVCKSSTDGPYILFGISQEKPKVYSKVFLFGIIILFE